MRRLRITSLLLFLLPSGLLAQSVRYQSQLIGSRGTPLAFQSVAVCTQPASTTTTPCSPLATLATSNATTSGGANPLLTDINGNFFFYAAPGRYTIQIYGSAITTPFVQPDTVLPCDPTGCTATFTGDALFKSGRPWYDVMAFGATNTGPSGTDDTAAIVAAMTAACAASPVGGDIYFPRGAGYKTANTGATPFNVPCSNLHFIGTTWSQLNSPQPPSEIIGAALTVPMFTVTGVSGIFFENLGFSGNSGSAGAIAISISGVNGIATLNHNFFDSWGGSAVLGTAAGNSTLWLTDNWAQNCLMVRPAAVDTACFDIGENDVQAHGNFVTTSVSTAAGNIGTGHTYAWAVRGSNGFFTNNMAEISQHGWLVASTASYNSFIGNRSFLQQGNGYNVQGSNNIFSGNKAIASSQTATNTFSGFTTTGGQNIFTGNIVEDGSLGNGNHTKNGFDDSVSVGATDFIGSNYSSNRIDAAIAGVLYNLTGSSPYRVIQPSRNATQTTATGTITLFPAVDGEVQLFNTVITGAVTVTLSPSGAWNGAKFRIIRGSAATGAFNLTACGKALASASLWVDCEFLGGAWIETATGAL